VDVARVDDGWVDTWITRTDKTMEQQVARVKSLSSLDVIAMTPRAKTPPARSRASKGEFPSLSPKKADVAGRAEAMVRRLALVRGSEELAEERAFALENARHLLKPGEKRKVRAPQLLRHEKAGELLVAEVNHILDKAKDAMSSEEGFLETDEVKAVKQDLAIAALLFKQQGSNIGREERQYLNRILKQFAPLIVREGKGEKAALAQLEALFRARAKSSQVKGAIRSLLGSHEMSRLASAIAESATRTSSQSAAMSASRSSQRGKRARAAVLKRRKARYVMIDGKKAKERSADTRSAGTATRSFVRSGSGSLRSARAGSLRSASSRSFRPSMIAKINEALKDMNIARDRIRRGAKPIHRFGQSLLAIRQLEDIVRNMGRAKGKAARDLRIEFVMTLLLQTPIKLSAESRDKLSRLMGAAFKDRDAAAVAAIVNLIAKKKSATPIKGKSQRTHRLSKYIFKALEKLLTKSEIKAVNKEIDHVSSISARSLSSLASTSSTALRRKRVSRRVVRSSRSSKSLRSSKKSPKGRQPYLMRARKPKAGAAGPPLASADPLRVMRD
jgi:hypothetical protein